MIPTDDKQYKHRCEGWRRTGGAFTLGPVVWNQCENEGEVMLTTKMKGEKKQTLPACKTCWQECIDKGIRILNVSPIIEVDNGN